MNFTSSSSHSYKGNETMKTMIFVLAGISCYGCGGEAFAHVDDSNVSDAGIDSLVEVDAVSVPPIDVRADMTGSDLVPDTFEASTDAGFSSDGGMTDADSDSVPTCGDDEVYPQSSPTCAKWITGTSFPLEKGCCRKETHTCGHVVTFSPFCVELH